MTERQPEQAIPILSPTQQIPSVPELAERLSALFGRHALLSQRLRELSRESVLMENGQNSWQDLEIQVVNLRFEMEALKQNISAESATEQITEFNALLEI